MWLLISAQRRSVSFPLRMRGMPPDSTSWQSATRTVLESKRNGMRHSTGIRKRQNSFMRQQDSATRRHSMDWQTAMRKEMEWNRTRKQQSIGIRQLLSRTIRMRSTISDTAIWLVSVWNPMIWLLSNGIRAPHLMEIRRCSIIWD